MDFAFSVLGFGLWTFEFTIFNFNFLGLAFHIGVKAAAKPKVQRPWTLGFGLRALDFGFGLWILDFGLKKL